MFPTFSTVTNLSLDRRPGAILIFSSVRTITAAPRSGPVHFLNSLAWRTPTRAIHRYCMLAYGNLQPNPLLIQHRPSDPSLQRGTTLTQAALLHRSAVQSRSELAPSLDIGTFPGLG